jgi:nucleoside phosphorylase
LREIGRRVTCVRAILAAAFVATLCMPADLRAQSSGPVCTGDCDGDGRVAIDELILLVRIALADAPADSCAAAAEPPAIDELVGSVSNSIAGCPPFIAVLSAFPAELVPLLDQATVEETIEVNGKMIRLGELGGVRVALGMTGIGLVNAANTTSALLDRLDVTGVVVSGVAGSIEFIGDVTVPVEWELEGGGSYAAHQPWLELASEIAASGEVTLQQCTERPSDPEMEICVLHEPLIKVGGIGHSDDPFNNMAFPCMPNGADVFGCEVPAGGSGADVMLPVFGTPPVPTTVDMETAAIAREATGRGLPYVAFRAVSDGMGDPLMLTVPFEQFFVYYRLAARNAAAATIEFLQTIADARSAAAGQN